MPWAEKAMRAPKELEYSERIFHDPQSTRFCEAEDADQRPIRWWRGSSEIAHRRLRRPLAARLGHAPPPPGPCGSKGSVCIGNALTAMREALTPRRRTLSASMAKDAKISCGRQSKSQATAVAVSRFRSLDSPSAPCRPEPVGTKGVPKIRRAPSARRRTKDVAEWHAASPLHSRG